MATLQTTKATGLPSKINKMKLWITNRLTTKPQTTNTKRCMTLSMILMTECRIPVSCKAKPLKQVQYFLKNVLCLAKTSRCKILISKRALLWRISLWAICRLFKTCRWCQLKMQINQSMWHHTKSTWSLQSMSSAITFKNVTLTLKRTSSRRCKL